MERKAKAARTSVTSSSSRPIWWWPTSTRVRRDSKRIDVTRNERFTLSQGRRGSSGTLKARSRSTPRDQGLPKLDAFCAT